MLVLQILFINIFFKLNPGHYLKISNSFSEINKKCYWNIKKIIQENKKIIPKLNNFSENKNYLKSLLEKTVIKQTISDVQIGSFLSGEWTHQSL